MTDPILEEPSARTWVEWDPARIRVAEMHADCGNYRLAADLCEMILTDDRVQGVLPVRATGLLGLPFSFERSARRAADHRRAERVLVDLDEWWKIAPDYALAELNTWGVLLGVGLAQKVWQRAVVQTAKGPQARVVPVLDPWHPRALRRDEEAGCWRVQTRTGEVKADPAQWVIHTPRSRKRPTAHAPWRAIARWCLLKSYARSDWGVEGERAAGVRTAIPPEPKVALSKEQLDAQKANRKELAANLKEMSRRASLVLPSGWDLKIVQSAANTYETFRAQIEIANAGIAIALAGQNLTSEVVGGSFAAAEVHRQIANVLLRGDAEGLAATLHEQVLTEWAAYNLSGGEASAPWPCWDTEPPEDLARKAQTWSSLSDALTKIDAQASRMGLEVDVEEVLRRAGVPTRPRPPQSETRQPGQVFKYHLDYGVLTLNEIRAGLGLEPIAGGDKPPAPLAGAPAEEPS